MGLFKRWFQKAKATPTSAIVFPQGRRETPVLVAVEDQSLRGMLIEWLQEGGFSATELTVSELLEMEPLFGSNEVVFVVLYAGPTTESMHAVAQHLYDGWSLLGCVWLVAYHPAVATDQDVFKLWALDSLWKYQSPNELVVLNRSIRDGVREVTETVQTLATVDARVAESRTEPNPIHRISAE